MSQKSMNSKESAEQAVRALEREGIADGGKAFEYGDGDCQDFRV